MSNFEGRGPVLKFPRQLRSIFPYRLGDAVAICDRCNFKFYHSELQETWEGLMCCGACWEPRHPQDFVRAVQDDDAVRNARPPQADVFLAAGDNTAAGLSGDKGWI